MTVIECLLRQNNCSWPVPESPPKSLSHKHKWKTLALVRVCHAAHCSTWQHRMQKTKIEVAYGCMMLLVCKDLWRHGQIQYVKVCKIKEWRQIQGGCHESHRCRSGACAAASCICTILLRQRNWFPHLNDFHMIQLYDLPSVHHTSKGPGLLPAQLAASEMLKPKETNSVWRHIFSCVPLTWSLFIFQTDTLLSAKHTKVASAQLPLGSSWKWPQDLQVYDFYN